MEELYYPSSENKGATAKLICVFVFAYADGCCQQVLIYKSLCTFRENHTPRLWLSCIFTTFSYFIHGILDDLYQWYA